MSRRVPFPALTWVLAGACLLLAVGQAAWGLEPEGLVRFRDWHVHLCWQQGFFDGLVAGEGWPRWITQANQGFGGPVFLFYPPLAYVLGSAVLALGADAPIALKAVYGLALLGGALGVFCWLRGRVSAPWALALAGIWLLLPAGSQLALHFNMPAGALALGLLPWIAWRLERRPAVVCDPLLVILLAALLYSHVLSAFQLALLLAGCVLALGLGGGPEGRAQALRLAVSGLLAAGLAAPFWLPLLGALDTVHIDQLREAPQWRVTGNLLFAAGELPHLAEATPGLLLLAALAWVAIRRPAADAAWPLYAGCGLTALWLSSALAAPLYEAVPALQFLQFGWRWDGLIALCALRLMAAALAPGEGRPGAMGLGHAVLLGALALAWLAAVPIREAATQRLAGAEANLHAQRCVWPNLEYRPQAMGNAWNADLSAWPRQPRLLHGIGRIEALDASLRRYRVDLRGEAEVLLPQLGYPGWIIEGPPGEARMDAGTSADGRLRLRLPAGRYTLLLRRAAPPGQLGGVLLAGAALVALLACVVTRRLRRRAGSRPAAGAGP
ncbi:6-pyruvoyl-tetrahydropterin synthase-related protein [Pseudomarimonas salicorniae]|uniref:6-pyruvoyl-tetrahydropterin synthase-related protein n=1 Tax=Pseudomarimonas salicorniae TaxID=2933270 RepID=A0ABT0GCR1_9GAMM|nr:6-pyruvoyl-tetrahydropterin synthase-related protein [Lysobacter sp. CAU 1642]MCK7592325.1 6-pyruvoyl-tetrahydropterin synthase-related protein [Lysobacter sp. CAU 1642]